MRREELVDLNAFATVAEEQSFTRAAAKLGTSQSALSHTRPIEEFPRRVRIGAARVWVPDLRGEEFEEAIGRARVPFCTCAPHGVEHAAEFDEAAVAGALHDAAPMGGDGGIDPPNPTRGGGNIAALRFC